MEQSSNKEVLIKVAVLMVTVLIVLGAVAFNKKDKDLNGSTNTKSFSTPSISERANSQVTSASSSTATSYKDGSYMARADYATPEDTENITVNVTLKDGVITETSADASTYSRESREYATAFVENYKSQVVGKKISAVKLSHVSGSSLTSQGFNDAIEQIKSQSQTSSNGS